MTRIGHVGRLMRFPVKSMRGETFDALDLGAVGIAGDRICALIDRESGKVASAKLPHRWRKLLGFGARLLPGADARGRPLIEMALPDGRQVRSDLADIDRLLSEAVGRDVTLAFSRPAGLEMDRARPDEVADRGAEQEVGADTLPLGMGAPEGGFVDFAPVHFITTASLGRVASAAATASVEPERFRPNIVIDTVGAPPFAENGWVGGTLTFGDQAAIEVILATPRCAVPTLAQGELPSSPRLTQLIGTLNKVPIMDMGDLACLGAYGRVTRAGPVRLGDEVRWSRH